MGGIASKLNNTHPHYNENGTESNGSEVSPAPKNNYLEALSRLEAQEAKTTALYLKENEIDKNRTLWSDIDILKENQLSHHNESESVQQRIGGTEKQIDDLQLHTKVVD